MAYILSHNNHWYISGHFLKYKMDASQKHWLLQHWIPHHDTSTWFQQIRFHIFHLCIYFVYQVDMRNWFRCNICLELTYTDADWLFYHDLTNLSASGSCSHKLLQVMVTILTVLSVWGVMFLDGMWTEDVSC